MSEFSQMIARLRELYLRLEAENAALLSQASAPSAPTPGLSTAAERQHYYSHGFLDGIKFFQACFYNHTTHQSDFNKKGCGNP